MKRKLGIGLSIIFFLLLFSYFFILIDLPSSFSLVEGTESIVRIRFPFDLYVSGIRNSVITNNGQRISGEHFRLIPGNLILRAETVGSSDLTFKLFGIIPIKSITVNVLPEIRVYPGGQAIGVLLKSRGVMVVGNSFVEGEDGRKYYPAQEAGIRVGDKILEINKMVVNDKVVLATEIQKNMKENKGINLLVENKDGERRYVRVIPVKNKQGVFMIGLYVVDGVAGVGTLTFINPENNEFGALGHEIIETNSQNRIDLREGKIIEAQISGIHSGQRGIPGEKLGTFFQSENIIGDIKINNQFGIFGKIKKFVRNPYFKTPIPVAANSEIVRGPAKIYTVVSGGKIEEFLVNIERVYHQSSPGEKGMIINITDPRLKELTGGIVQGMSGSPIVQNNKLVGAITHVFVNEPSKGYGVFAEWMVSQTLGNFQD